MPKTQIKRLLEDLFITADLGPIPEADISTAEDVAYAIDTDGNVVGLSLSSCRLRTVPDRVSSFGKLRQLRLFGNGLEDLPNWFGDLAELKSLYLGENEFRAIPDVAYKLPQLQTLGLNNNQIRVISPEIAQLQSLRVLGLGSNSLSELPPHFAQLPSLSQVYLANNYIRTLADDFLRATKLETIDLSGNPLQSLPDSIGQASHLTGLSLRNTQITSLPSELFKLPRLRRLSIAESNIATLPSELASAEHLEVLHLGSTKLVALPDELAHLKKLRLLRCASIGLREFPQVVLSLPSLVVLDLSSNSIRSIPDAIAKLTNLEALKLASCGLSAAPPVLFCLPSLKHLDLRSNKITSLPEDVSKIRWKIALAPGRSTWHQSEIMHHSEEPPPNWSPSIEPLEEPKRAFGFFADSIGKLEQPGVFIAHNPLQSPPLEVALAGRRALVSYYESISEERRPVNEVKILLVGDGGSGKTSLAKAILGQTFDPHESQTHGIEIRDYAHEVDGNTFIGHLWDFGGQEMMHATHQFFLSRRSIYLLVLDGRKEEKTEYWLKHIETFGGSSPIILVLNKVDENPGFEVNRKFLREKYPSIRSFVRVSCKDRSGIEDVARELRQLVGSVESAKTLWPSSWFRVKRELEESNNDYVEMSQFRSICRRNGVSAADHRDTLLQFLHDLGVVLNFNDLPLKDTNVINPAWITDGVYRIINSKYVADRGGALDVSQLRDLLDAKRHPSEKHNFVIELMKKFEICYEISDTKLLLPGLLPVEQPNFRFSSQEVALFRLQYEFLPKSVMPRFIVRMHDDIEETLSWRTGVVLTNHELDARALVRADDEEARIDIVVSGSQRKDYLGILIYTFRAINRSFQGINCVEKVPLPDFPNVVVGYDHLMRLERSGEKTYFPDGATRSYSISSLLGHVQPDRKTDDEILALLKALHEKSDDEKTLLQKVQQAVVLKPTIFGVGIDVNKIVEMFFKDMKSRRKKKTK